MNDIVRILMQNFSVKLLGTLNEYIGCKILRSEEKAWLKQPDILKKVEDILKKIEVHFGDLMEREIKTPLGTGIMLQHPNDVDELIDNEKPQKYRSGVGLLLYLVKLSRPDFCNAV